MRLFRPGVDGGGSDDDVGGDSDRDHDPTVGPHPRDTGDDGTRDARGYGGRPGHS